MKDVLARKDITSTAKLLFVLSEIGRPASVPEIRKAAIENGFAKAKKIDIRKLLAESNPRAIKLPEGWELSRAGKNWLADLGIGNEAEIISPFAQKLRTHLARITDKETKEFLNEAIGCLEAKHHRAAVVLSWVGAVSVLQDYVLRHRLADFNKDALANKDIKKPVQNKDDFATLKEDVFLTILGRISVLSKNQKAELKTCLDRRNGCGHPNTYAIREPAVAAHIDTLLLNVFEKFGS